MAARSKPVLDDPFPDVDGRSPAINSLKHQMLHVARDAHVAVLILGEPGSGKERIARAIHRLSPRAGRPFAVVNCGLSPALAEDELFGHMRGAFTGAMHHQPGPFERANGGTVLLDDVARLTPDLQTKLLRMLQERSVRRIGGRCATPFAVRVISATTADLTLAMRRGRFRQDLYYRLNVYELRVPPLRRRGAADLRRLVDAILKHLSARRHHPIPTVVPAVWDVFEQYRWPGNIRELESTIEHMIVAAGDDPLLTAAHLPGDFAALKSIAPTAPSAAEALAVLERNAFNRCRTASQLGVSRHQLYRLLKGRAVPSRPAVRALA